LILEADVLLAAAALGLIAGVASGLLGIGGGVLFVPTLVFAAGLSELEAIATSLVAVVVVGLVGAWRQHAYGNLRLRDALVVGALSPLGVAAGTAVANIVPERALAISFGVLQLYFAWRLARRALHKPATA